MDILQTILVILSEPITLPVTNLTQMHFFLEIIYLPLCI